MRTSIRWTKVAESGQLEPSGSSGIELDDLIGLASAKVDDKGRLKLPVQQVTWLQSFGDKKYFVTTLNRLEARIYPISQWKENEKRFTEPGVDAKDWKAIRLVAYYYGEVTEIDGQNRIMLPTTLRRELKLEGQPVMLDAHPGHVKVLGQGYLDERMRSALDNVEEKIDRIEARGLK